MKPTLPKGYIQLEAGAIQGPNGGKYVFTGSYEIEAVLPIYEQGGKYYTFDTLFGVKQTGVSPYSGASTQTYIVNAN